MDMSITTGTDLSQLTGTYTLDPAHSRIGFVARHAMVTGSADEYSKAGAAARK